MRVVQGPVGLLPDVNPIERRLGEEDLPVRDELRKVPVEEGQQQRRDVVTVGVRVGQDDNLPVPKPPEIKVLTHAASERGDEIGKLLVLEHLREREAFGVHHLAAKRQDGLLPPIASLLGGTAR